MGKLSLRSLLVLIAIAPLCAFLWLAVSSVYNSYRNYEALREQIVVQALANTGGMIAQALPGEAFATPENLKQRRSAVDATLADLKAAYANWKNAGNSDATIEQAYAKVLEQEKLIKPYRDHVDAGKADPTEALAVLQPASAAGLELVRRSAATIDDLSLSRLIDGFHALMQVNDAGLIEIRLGEAYFGGQSLDGRQSAFILHAKGLRDRYQPQILEFLPNEITQAYKGFDGGEGGKFLKAALNSIYSGPPKGKDDASLNLWSKAAGERAGMMVGLVAKTGAALKSEADRRLSELRSIFIRGFAIAVLVSTAVIVLFLFVVRSVSGMIRKIEARMRSLAGMTVNPTSRSSIDPTRLAGLPAPSKSSVKQPFGTPNSRPRRKRAVAVSKPNASSFSAAPRRMPTIASTGRPVRWPQASSAWLRVTCFAKSTRSSRRSSKPSSGLQHLRFAAAGCPFVSRPVGLGRERRVARNLRRFGQSGQAYRTAGGFA